jgi:fucose permease
MAGSNLLIITTLTSTYLVGMVLSLLGGIRVPLAQRLGVSEARVDGLLTVLNLALIPMMLVSGLLIDKWGVEVMLIAGSLLAAVGVAFLAVSRTYFQALGSVLVVGASAPVVSTASIVLMPRAFFPDHLAASFNLGNVIFGLSALLTPTVGERVIRRWDLRRALLLLALLCVVPAALAGLTPPREMTVPNQEADLNKVLGDPFLWLTALVFLLYFPVETFFATWTGRYLTDLGYPPRSTTYLVSGFWLSFLTGRFLAALLQEQSRVLPAGSEPWLILVLGLLTAIMLGNLVGAYYPSSAAMGILLVGFCLGPIFPTLVGIVAEAFPNDQGIAYGGMFALGAAGSWFFPPLLGVYARRKTVRNAMRVPMVLALIMAAPALVLGLVRR